MNERIRLRLFNAGPMPWRVDKGRAIALMITRRSHASAIEYEYEDDDAGYGQDECRRREDGDEA